MPTAILKFYLEIYIPLWEQMSEIKSIKRCQMPDKEKLILICHKLSISTSLLWQLISHWAHNHYGAIHILQSVTVYSESSSDNGYLNEFSVACTA